MKRREGGVNVSSRLGAAGRVFARVHLLTLCVRFCTFSAAAPCQYAGRAHENPTQLRFEYTIFQKLPLTKSDPADTLFVVIVLPSIFSRLVKTSLETITFRISRTMVYTQVQFFCITFFLHYCTCHIGCHFHVACQKVHIWSNPSCHLFLVTQGFWIYWKVSLLVWPIVVKPLGLLKVGLSADIRLQMFVGCLFLAK